MAGRPPSREAPPFGQRLAALRKERGLTQVELAEKLEVTRKLVDYYERRAQNPSSEFVSKVAQFFGVSVAQLFGEEPPSTKKPGKPKPGPLSHLEERMHRIRQLPRREQEMILRMLDGILATGASHKRR